MTLLQCHRIKWLIRVTVLVRGPTTDSVNLTKMVVDNCAKCRPLPLPCTLYCEYENLKFFLVFLHIILKKNPSVLWLLVHNNLVVSHLFAGKKNDLLQVRAISLNYFSY